VYIKYQNIQQRTKHFSLVHTIQKYIYILETKMFYKIYLLFGKFKPHQNNKMGMNNIIISTDSYTLAVKANKIKEVTLLHLKHGNKEIKKTHIMVGEMSKMNIPVVQFQIIYALYGFRDLDNSLLKRFLQFLKINWSIKLQNGFHRYYGSYFVTQTIFLLIELYFPDPTSLIFRFLISWLILWPPCNNP